MRRCGWIRIDCDVCKVHRHWPDVGILNLEKTVRHLSDKLRNRRGHLPSECVSCLIEKTVSCPFLVGQRFQVTERKQAKVAASDLEANVVQEIAVVTR